MSGHRKKKPPVDPEKLAELRDRLYDASDLAADAMLRGLAQDLEEKANKLARYKPEFPS